MAPAARGTPPAHGGGGMSGLPLDPGLVLGEPLGLLLLLPLAWAIRRWRRRRPGLASPILRLPGGPPPRSWSSTWAAVCGTAGLTMIVFALARPSLRRPVPWESEGVEILLVLDVSSSMTARDLDPERDRLEVARTAAERFVAGRPRDRIGLIRFARYADPICPLTLDHEAVATLLRGLEPVPADGPEDATGIGRALARAAAVLAGGEARSRVAILLTDGQENVATAQTPAEIGPLEGAALCRDEGIRVHAIGVGEADGGLLARIAEATGGGRFAAEDAESLEEVWRDIDRLETSRFREPRWIRIDLQGWCGAAALVLLMLGRWLGGGRREVLP
ncbi:MAG: VWA domain-containing protein [Planctomycetota bacterium]|nr:MAG: VWA domain-containing protein [Planctomycetota bacterium]